MASPVKQTLRDEVQTAWKSAVISFVSLKKDGKISQAQWDQLRSFKDPQGLLTDIENAPYATTEGTKKLLRLAEASVDAVLRFDNEIANIAQGIASSSFGIPSAAWGALRVVLHICQDIFKSPDVLVEIVAKIFVFMPRIDLYFELFHDQQDKLNIQSLLVSLYKTIIDFNITSMTWHSGSKGSKIVRSFRQDPREQFQSIFKQMSDTSVELKERVEAINLKAQKDRHQKLLGKFRDLELTHQRHIDDVRDIIIAKNEESVKQAMAKHLEDAKEQQKLAEAVRAEAAEQEKRKRNELLRPYNILSEVRAALWRVLHQAPWTVVVENLIPEINVAEQSSQSRSWQFWEKGKYVSHYPIDDGLGDITMVIDWKPMNNPEKPLIRWMISTPNSLFYPGQHFGRIELNTDIMAFRKSTFDVVDSRLRIFWDSPIFSPLPSIDQGLLSSTGPLEEKSSPLVLTMALQSIAHHLIHGPFSARFLYSLSWHHMNSKIDRYFNRKTSTREEEGMRATAFFANAFTRDLEGLENFGLIGLQTECQQASIMAIEELTKFYKIESQIAEDQDFKVVNESFEGLYSQQEWVQEDRKWAQRIAELAGFEHLATAAKKSKPVNEVAKQFDVVAQSKEREKKSAPPTTAKSPSLSPQASSIQPLRKNVGWFADDELPEEWSPLHRAVWHQDLNAVLCLAAKSTVNVTDARGCTPLHLACLNRQSLIFTFCQVDGRHLRPRVLCGSDKRCCFPYRRDNPGAALQIATALINAGADPNAEASKRYYDTAAWTPMHCIANRGWVDLAHLLLEKGGSAFSKKMCSPLCWADDTYGSRYYPIPGMTRMKDLLRAHISDEQMREIKALHERRGYGVDWGGEVIEEPRDR